MEKRTLGSFLAALRRANGMTQRELAEKLNVSDKAVSRWERDECAPDLTLIPVIADIFGVTSDELLRGARADRTDREESPERTVRSDKQVDRILKSNEMKFWIRSMISLGIISVGITVGFGALGSNWSTWGILFGGICLMSATISQHIFSVLAFSAVNTDEFDIEKIKRHRRNLVNILKSVVFAPMLMLEVIGFLIVFIVRPPSGVNELTVASLVRFCVLLFPLTLLLWWIYQSRLAKREFCFFRINERSRLQLKIKIWSITAILVSATVAVQLVFSIHNVIDILYLAEVLVGVLVYFLIRNRRERS